MSESSPDAAMASAPVAPEEEARANFYALLARLYAAAPDAGLLEAIAQADDLEVEAGDGAARSLAEAWRALKDASAAADAVAVAQEHVDLFVGVGKSEVSLHAAAYMKSSAGSVLAEVRSELMRLSLGRQAGRNLYEDHLAAVLETMRVLIAGAPGVCARALGEQHDFFARYVSPWVESCCGAIIASPIANYYRRVAEFTELFVAIERDSFAIE